MTFTKICKNGKVKKKRSPDGVGHEQEVQRVLPEMRVLSGGLQHLEDLPQSCQTCSSGGHQVQVDGMFSMQRFFAFKTCHDNSYGKTTFQR